MQNFLKKKSNVDVPASRDFLAGRVLQPVTGEVITLDQVEDATFAAGMLGGGCAIRPTEEIVYAPFNGKVERVAITNHAVTLTNTDGMNVMVHVGVNTVELNGKGFEVFVQANQEVKAGQPLIRFDQKFIHDSGHASTITVLVLDTEKNDSVKLVSTGAGDAGDLMLKY